MTNKHIPVLLNEVLAAFQNCPQGVIVDCTLGGAGHTSALLKKFDTVKILGCDMDFSAISAGEKQLKPLVDAGRLAFYHGNFSTLVDTGSEFPAGFAPPWSGMLLDLGYSSNQLEAAEYGMSFSIDGPLDMRLSRQGQSAWDLLSDCSEQELGDILKAYGEIEGAYRIARRIIEAIQKGEVVNSTSSLAGFLERIQGGRHRSKIHPATLVFQALRIAVNDELRVLDHFLDNAILKLEVSGRIAIITFHSLEDRLVKRWGLKNAETLRILTKKPIEAGLEEVNVNPRSRSAKLRVYEKVRSTP